MQVGQAQNSGLPDFEIGDEKGGVRVGFEGRSGAALHLQEGLTRSRPPLGGGQPLRGKM